MCKWLSAIACVLAATLYVAASVYIVMHSIKYQLCCRAETDMSLIRIYDGRGTKEPLKVLDKLHGKPVSIIRVSEGHQSN